ncbi:hypothetical protein VCHC52A1_2123, partial [Vibrio cholerae HC-52A1]
MPHFSSRLAVSVFTA